MAKYIPKRHCSKCFSMDTNARGDWYRDKTDSTKTKFLCSKCYYKVINSRRLDYKQRWYRDKKAKLELKRLQNSNYYYRKQLAVVKSEWQSLQDTYPSLRNKSIMHPPRHLGKTSGVG